ncbi:MAG: hypothetical protein M3Z03_16380 [Actinomycetota bacterium]|nr:hypothetical protein [Actinomycetota bacterium]
MRLARWVLATAMVAVLAGTLPAQADEPADPSAPGAALVEVCATSGLAGLPELGPGLCATVEAGAVLLAAVCGHLPVDPDACADLTDGRPIDPAAVDAFAAGWVPRALRLQALLSEDRPLRDDLIPHTHNSFNAPQYGPTLTTADPNQRYSLIDQLRMGIRAIELDVHWLPSPYGTVDAGGYAVTLCHGQTEEVAGVRIHVGCTVDRPAAPGLAELSAFLRAPGNEREFLLLYLQNELDGSPAGHGATAALLEEHLGDLIYAPPTGQAPGSCADLPVYQSRAEILATGRRVLVVGNCGPGAWSSLVFQRGAGWDERSNSAGYPPAPACHADRAARDYDEHWIRVTEDRTWLSALTGAAAPITVAEVRSMVQCGVELIGLDRIGPADPRLAELVWSWAPDEPTAAGQCAAWQPDGRFHAAGCAEARQPACQRPDGSWQIGTEAVAWSAADAACTSDGARFDVPRSAWSNEQLRIAAQATPDASLWLNLGDGPAGWRPGAQPAGLDGPGPTLPATGGGRSLLALGTALLLVAAATSGISRGWGRGAPRTPTAPRRR